LLVLSFTQQLVDPADTFLALKESVDSDAINECADVLGSLAVTLWPLEECRRFLPLPSFSHTQET
jgi:hypothetical protein